MRCVAVKPTAAGALAGCAATAENAAAEDADDEEGEGRPPSRQPPTEAHFTAEVEWAGTFNPRAHRTLRADQLEQQAQPMLKNGYGQYLMQVLRERVF